MVPDEAMCTQFCLRLSAVLGNTCSHSFLIANKLLCIALIIIQCPCGIFDDFYGCVTVVTITFIFVFI